MTIKNREIKVSQTTETYRGRIVGIESNNMFFVRLNSWESEFMDFSIELNKFYK